MLGWGVSGRPAQGSLRAGPLLARLPAQRSVARRHAVAVCAKIIHSNTKSRPFTEEEVALAGAILALPPGSDLSVTFASRHEPLTARQITGLLTQLNDQRAPLDLIASVFAWLQSRPELPTGDRFIYTRLMSIYTKRGAPARALEAFQAMRDRGIQPDNVAFNTASWPGAGAGIPGGKTWDGTPCLRTPSRRSARAGGWAMQRRHRAFSRT